MTYEWCIALPSMVLVMSRCLPFRARLVLLGLSLFPGLDVRRYLFHVDIYVPALGAQALWTFTNVWTVAGLWGAVVWRLVRMSIVRPRRSSNRDRVASSDIPTGYRFAKPR